MEGDERTDFAKIAYSYGTNMIMENVLCNFLSFTEISSVSETSLMGGRALQSWILSYTCHVRARTL